MKREKRILILGVFSFLFVFHYFLLVWNGDGLIFGLVVLPLILFFMTGAGCILQSVFLCLDHPVLKTIQDDTVPRESGRIAISGTIEPSNGQLSSPYSREECVLYEYHVYHRTIKKQRQGGDIVSYYPEAVGWALVPSSVNSIHGSFHLSDYPKIIDFPKKEIEESLGPFQIFIQQIKFEKPGRILTLLLPTLVAFIPSLSWHLFLKPPGDNGVIRTDIDYSGGRDAFHADKIEERFVPSGSKVIAIGTLDSGRSALTSGWNDLRLINADSGLEEALKSVRVEIAAYIVGGIFLLGCWLFISHMLEIWDVYSAFLRWIY